MAKATHRSNAPSETCISRSPNCSRKRNANIPKTHLLNRTESSEHPHKTSELRGQNVRTPCTKHQIALRKTPDRPAQIVELPLTKIRATQRSCHSERSEPTPFLRIRF